MEALHSNPICALPPAAWVSRSEKLEHGKSRALFACDTINYMHFDAPCTAVERMWHGQRCILQPGEEADAYNLASHADQKQNTNLYTGKIHLQGRILGK